MSEITDLAEKLKSEGEKFSAIFAGLTAEQWQTEVYTEDTTWTIPSIAHFVTQRALIKLFEQIRRGAQAHRRNSRLTVATPLCRPG
jgi:hypothetical protein